MNKHLAKAKDYIGKGESFYRKAAEEIEAARAEAGERRERLTDKQIAEDLGKSVMYVRRLTDAVNNLTRADKDGPLVVDWESGSNKRSEVTRQTLAKASPEDNPEIPPPGYSLRLQLAAIAGNEPSSSFLEIRPFTKDDRVDSRARTFLPIRDTEQAVERILGLALDHQVFIGCAPRVRQEGGVDAIERVWCLWADCDSDASVAALRDFRPLPSIVIRSGTGERVHAWWPLRQPISPKWAKRANRRIALALGADMRAAEAARILRPAGTLNWKHDPPTGVECRRLELDVFTLPAVVGYLPDTPDYQQPAHSPASKYQVTGPAALDGLARCVREALPPVGGNPGERNNILFWAACRLREHVDAGTVDEHEGREVLRQAALATGLSEHAVEATLDSALSRKAAA